MLFLHWKIQRPFFHKFQHSFVSHIFAGFLMSCTNWRQNFNQFFFEESSQKFTTCVVLKREKIKRYEIYKILKEKSEIATFIQLRFI